MTYHPDEPIYTPDGLPVLSVDWYDQDTGEVSLAYKQPTCTTHTCYRLPELKGATGQIPERAPIRYGYSRDSRDTCDTCDDCGRTIKTNVSWPPEGCCEKCEKKRAERGREAFRRVVMELARVMVELDQSEDAAA